TDLDVLDTARPAALVRLVERHDAVLDGDEVAVAEISGGAVAGLPGAVDRVQLDEALAPIAQQAHRKEAHLALNLTLDLIDERALLVAAGGDDVGSGLPGGAVRRRLGLSNLKD